MPDYTEDGSAPAWYGPVGHATLTSYELLTEAEGRRIRKEMKEREARRVPFGFQPPAPKRKKSVGIPVKRSWSM